VLSGYTPVSMMGWEWNQDHGFNVLSSSKLEVGGISVPVIVTIRACLGSRTAVASERATAPSIPWSE